MRWALGRSGQATATATFYALVGLALGLLLALWGFVSHFAPIYDACASAWDNLLRWVSSLGMLLPLTVAVSVVGIAGLTLARQWQTTRHLLTSLAPYRVQVPSRLARIARSVGLEDRIDCVSGVLTAPFCYGFIQPRVYFPTALLAILDDAELRAVLRHEGYHARSRDPLKIWLSRALSRGLYFLPLAGDLRDSYLAAKEIAADETTGNAEELPLASALLKLLSADEKELSVDRPASVSIGTLNGKSLAGLISVNREPANEAEERLRRLVDGQPAQLRLPPIASVLLSTVIVVAIFAGSYASLHAASTMPISRECAAQKVRRRPESAYSVPLLPGTHNAAVRPADAPPGVGQEENAASVARGVAGPGATTGQSSCDLLTPSCRHVGEVAATAKGSTDSNY